FLLLLQGRGVLHGARVTSWRRRRRLGLRRRRLLGRFQRLGCVAECPGRRRIFRHQFQRLVQSLDRVVVLVRRHRRLPLRRELGVFGLTFHFFLFVARLSHHARLGVGAGLLRFLKQGGRVALALGRGRVAGNQLQRFAIGFRRLVVALGYHRGLGLLHEAVV